jgi:Tfp pilus assembly PilM family ATPase
MTYDEKKFDPDYIHLVAPEMTIAAGLAIRQSPF